MVWGSAPFSFSNAKRLSNRRWQSCFWFCLVALFSDDMSCDPFFVYQAVKKRPSAVLSSLLPTATHHEVRRVPRKVGRLA